MDRQPLTRGRDDDEAPALRRRPTRGCGPRRRPKQGAHRRTHAGNGLPGSGLPGGEWL